MGVILLVDARHPGLENDRNALGWLAGLEMPLVVAATKIDRLARSARQTKLRAHEKALAHPVLPVSAKRGDGLPELWTALLALAASAPPPGTDGRRPSPDG
jgi:GTP-binding protein